MNSVDPLLPIVYFLKSGGTWVAQPVECPTLDFGSGHDPRVVGQSSASGSVLSMEPAWHSLSLSFSLSVPLTAHPPHTLSLR